ncbi:hypothetical protein TSUD_403110 [Trifolium subterraneum]|uniref:PPM-type phosphatase domain-containing protein n=1 Tax=Trifolium subterraneum TaxID=3900 RepID=A0A2Z6NS74_TRISU|nr:hypothetical protein TSUD_403110 [Trifolium subterraneum]
MAPFPSLVNVITRTISLKKDKSYGKDNDARKVVEAMAKEARKNEMLISSSGIVKSSKSNNFSCVFTKKGQKGFNQDRLIVWEENLAEKSLEMDFKMETNHKYDIWKQSYIKTFAAIDQDLKQHTGIDSFQSGTTALTVIKQGEYLIIANVGDSRAVLATTSDNGTLTPTQLTTDLKPNLPKEAERIMESKGRVFCMEDEPGVYRVWMPNGKTPGLAISRAFGDYCVKDFGLISVPDVTQRKLTSMDQFVILATDGVWDVISNQAAIKIVGSTPNREKAAERLVKCATHEWKRKRKGIAIDDISAICLFFHSASSHATTKVVE